MTLLFHFSATREHKIIKEESRISQISKRGVNESGCFNIQESSPNKKSSFANSSRSAIDEENSNPQTIVEEEETVVLKTTSSSSNDEDKEPNTNVKRTISRSRSKKLGQNIASNDESKVLSF